MKSETRTIELFDRIHLKDIGSLILTQGDQVALTIEADEEILPDIVSTVRNKTLVLGMEDTWVNNLGKLLSNVFSNTKRRVTYRLTCTSLEEIKLSGNCDLECDSLIVKQLSLQISGLGDLKFERLDCNQLETHISGRGEFRAAGRAECQTVRISGSGEYNAPNLASQSTRIVVSGQGNATIRVEKELDINITGLGQVDYYGSPKLHQVISGSGKVKRLNDS